MPLWKEIIARMGNTLFSQVRRRAVSLPKDWFTEDPQPDAGRPRRSCRFASRHHSKVNISIKCHYLSQCQGYWSQISMTNIMKMFEVFWGLPKCSESEQSSSLKIISVMWAGPGHSGLLLHQPGGGLTRRGTYIQSENPRLGLPWWSSGLGSAVPIQGMQAQGSVLGQGTKIPHVSKK